MYINKLPKKYAINSKQQGMVLIVGLIMVLLITIIGITAIRGSGLQESMAGNMRDRNIAFQAGESALREGESNVDFNVTILPEFSCATGVGLCPDQSAIPQNAVIYWSSDDWNTLAKETDFDFEDVASASRYVVEEIKGDIADCAAKQGNGIDLGAMAQTGDCTTFRTTALASGIGANTEVVLESTYTRP